jgi:hypothetical protein
MMMIIIIIIIIIHFKAGNYGRRYSPKQNVSDAPKL